ncbi:hypothetical protein Daus18300_010879 [Diaporthe australafricana]|uniref:Rhodopsin domain-containing protein n=1 Tax=Diaporthe australafricana TaxID=127596 RepID=A0ABR3W8Q7_9PEZI
MGTHTSLAVCTLAVNWTLTLLAFLAVIYNCWHKFACLSMRIGPDDILIVLSFVIGTVLVSLSTWTILDEGQGEHQQDVSANQLEKAAKSLLVSEALWTLVTGLLRTAACLLIYRIFCVSTQTRRIAIAIMALSAALAAASIIQIFLICRLFSGLRVYRNAP